MKMNRIKCSDIHQYTLDNINYSTNIENNENINTKTATNKNTDAKNIFGKVLNAENNYLERLKNPIVKTNYIKCTEFKPLSDAYSSDCKIEQQEISNERDNTASKATEIKTTESSTETLQDEVLTGTSSEISLNESIEDASAENIKEYTPENLIEKEEDREKDNIQTCNITIKASPAILELLDNITIKKAPEGNNDTSDNINSTTKKNINISSLKDLPLADILKGLLNIAYVPETPDDKSPMIEIYTTEADTDENVKNNEEEKSTSIE